MDAALDPALRVDDEPEGDEAGAGGGREVDVEDVHGVYRAIVLLTLCLSHAVLPVDGATRGSRELMA